MGYNKPPSTSITGIFEVYYITIVSHIERVTPSPMYFCLMITEFIFS